MVPSLLAYIMTLQKMLCSVWKQVLLDTYFEVFHQDPPTRGYPEIKSIIVDTYMDVHHYKPCLVQVIYNRSLSSVEGVCTWDHNRYIIGLGGRWGLWIG